MTSKLPLDIYLRLSDLRQEDLTDSGEVRSFIHDEDTLRKLAKSRERSVGLVIVENDTQKNGKPKPASAFKKKKIKLEDGSEILRVIRPGFQRLLRRIKTGESGGFLAVDLDRAVRDPRDLEDLLDAVDVAKASVFSLTGSLNLENGVEAHQKTAARVLTAMASQSSEDTSRRVRRRKETDVAAGSFLGGRRRFGYEADGIRVRETEKAEIVAAYHKVLADATLKSIVQDLIDRNVPTVTGARWCTQTLKDILRRPRNAGIVVHRGQVTAHKAQWDKLVEVEVFNAAVAKLGARKQEKGPTPVWLCSGIARCSCGTVLMGQPQRKNGTAAVYRCRDKSLKPNAVHSSRNAEKLDLFVEDVVVEWCAQPAAIEHLLPERTDVDVVAVRARIVELEADMQVKTKWHHEKRITDAVFLTMTELTMKEIAELEQTLASTRSDSAANTLVAAAGRSADLEDRRSKVRAKWKQLSLGVKRQIIKDLVRVTLKAAGRGPGFNPSFVDVEWNYQ